MDLDSLVNGEYLEYFIIGAHTSIWVALLFSWVLSLPLSKLSNINILLGVLLLPFIYILGLLMDSVTQLFLRPLRSLVRRLVCGPPESRSGAQDIPQTDEIIAALSPSLYAGYEWRMRRTKAIGAAILNWIALGATLLTLLGDLASHTALVVEIATATLAALSLFSWIDLTARAYSYQTQAFEVIRLLPDKQIHK